MEGTLQVDLSKPEAPADQAVNATSAPSTAVLDPSRLKSLSQKLPGDTARSSRGGSVSTASLKWSLNSSQSRSTSPASHETTMEMGNTNDGSKVFTLQPQDTDFGAWSYVASAFAFYIVVWGFPQAFPIFQTHLSSGANARFPDSQILPLLAPGLQDIEEGILFQFLPKSPKYRRPLVMAGIVTMITALVLASFASAAAEI
ncbi:MAG: hypothetical protein Q9190_001160, partial [Brigantiaea leucoxantha]